MLPTRWPAAISTRLGSTEAAIVYPATANDNGRLVSHMSRTAAPYPGPVMAPESRLRSFCGGPDNSQENRPENGPEVGTATAPGYSEPNYLKFLLSPPIRSVLGPEG